MDDVEYKLLERIAGALESIEKLLAESADPASTLPDEELARRVSRGQRALARRD